MTTNRVYVDHLVVDGLEVGDGFGASLEAELTRRLAAPADGGLSGAEVERRVRAAVMAVVAGGQRSARGKGSNHG